MLALLIRQEPNQANLISADIKFQTWAIELDIIRAGSLHQLNSQRRHKIEHSILSKPLSLKKPFLEAFMFLYVLVVFLPRSSDGDLKIFLLIRQTFNLEVGSSRNQG